MCVCVEAQTHTQVDVPIMSAKNFEEKKSCIWSGYIVTGHKAKKYLVLSHFFSTETLNNVPWIIRMKILLFLQLHKIFFSLEEAFHPDVVILFEEKKLKLIQLRFCLSWMKSKIVSAIKTVVEIDNCDLCLENFYQEII